MTTAATIDRALARRENARRLMRDALGCYEDGMEEAGEALRMLSRLEYARAVALLLDCLEPLPAHEDARTTLRYVGAAS